MKSARLEICRNKHKRVINKHKRVILETMKRYKSAVSRVSQGNALSYTVEERELIDKKR